MIEENDTAHEEEVTQEFVPPSTDVPKYFSNVSRITTNINGASFLFGEVYPVGIQGPANEGRSVCLVQMSMPSAKSLYLILRKLLQDYEEKWGEVPVHPSIAEEFGD